MVGRRGLERSLLTMAQEKADGQAPGKRVARVGKKNQALERSSSLCSPASAQFLACDPRTCVACSATQHCPALFQRYRDAAYLHWDHWDPARTGRDRPCWGTARTSCSGQRPTAALTISTAAPSSLSLVRNGGELLGLASAIITHSWCPFRV